MQNAKATRTPLPLSNPIYDARDPLLERQKYEKESVSYRALLGSILYLATRTRPDNATTVSMLGTFQEEPASKHCKMVKNVIRYLIFTRECSYRTSGKHVSFLRTVTRIGHGTSPIVAPDPVSYCSAMADRFSGRVGCSKLPHNRQPKHNLLPCPAAYLRPPGFL